MDSGYLTYDQEVSLILGALFLKYGMKLYLPPEKM